ncbi:MAG: adenylate/guanylate cyclase domain-containing protein [Alphaproteobacteria bacterium]|nr:adenylate/guanylate cyclase domain-containing protein [Alphaproteobacteria bacterium]
MGLRSFFGLPNAPDPSQQATIDNQIRDGIRFAGVVRVIAVLFVAVLLTITVPPERLWYYLLLCAGFLVFGLIPFYLARRTSRPIQMQGLFAVLDAVLLVIMLMVPDPTLQDTFPPQLQLRFHNHLYLFVLLCGSAFCYSPALVLWTGACLASAWSVGVFWIASLSDSFTDVPAWIAENTTADGVEPTFVDALMDPGFVNLFQLINEVVLLMIAAGVLAGAVYRQRRHLLRQVTAEGERQNLARYFSPNLVDSMSRSRDPFATVARHPVATIFADLNGFTRFSETADPEEVVKLLRRFHGDMADVIFAHGGTLDKYLGDGVMATFGTPESRPDDAARALACVRTMQRTVGDWARERESLGEKPLSVGIGAHYGDAVVGNVGNNRRLEFTVIGDNVNVAARLEDLKNTLQSGIVVSEDLVEAARAAGAASSLFDGLERHADIKLFGREEPVTVYKLAP